MVKISHLTFIVKDLEKATSFFTDIFHAEVVYSSGSKNYSISKEKFLSIDSIWIVVMEGKPLNEKTYNHIAFKVSPEEFPVYVKRVKNLGVEIKKDRERIPGEGQSIYFYDYDNHLFEIHDGTLKERMHTYKIKLPS